MSKVKKLSVGDLIDQAEKISGPDTSVLINRTGEDTWSMSTVGYRHSDHHKIDELFIKSGVFKYDSSKGSIQEFDRLCGRTFTHYKLRNAK